MLPHLEAADPNSPPFRLVVFPAHVQRRCEGMCWSSFNVWPQLISRLAPSCRFSSPHVVLRPIDRTIDGEDQSIERFTTRTFTYIDAIAFSIDSIVVNILDHKSVKGFIFGMSVEKKYEGLFWKTFIPWALSSVNIAPSKIASLLRTCSFSAHKIARYVSHSVHVVSDLLLRIFSHKQAQGVISIC